MPDLFHYRDPLMNTGYFVSRCLCCGREYRETLATDAPVLWVGCIQCGHLYRAPNRTRWH